MQLDDFVEMKSIGVFFKVYPSEGDEDPLEEMKLEGCVSDECSVRYWSL